MIEHGIELSSLSTASPFLFVDIELIPSSEVCCDVLFLRQGNNRNRLFMSLNDDPFQLIATAGSGRWRRLQLEGIERHGLEGSFAFELTLSIWLTSEEREFVGR